MPVWNEPNKLNKEKDVSLHQIRLSKALFRHCLFMTLKQEPSYQVHIP